MTSLSFEILIEIFRYFPRHCKMQLLLVCKEWHAAASMGLDSYVVLNSRMEAKQLFGPNASLIGSRVRHLTYKNTYGGTIGKFDLVSILNACSNLRTLEIVEPNPILLTHLYHADDLITLDSIQEIRAPCLKKPSKKYIATVYSHGHKLKALDLWIDLLHLDFIPGDNKFHLYLSKFVALKRLRLQFNSKVAIHDILDACPQLESLHLPGGPLTNTNLEVVYSPAGSADDKRRRFNKFKLRYLEINADYLTQQMVEYLSQIMDTLYELKITDGALVNGSLISCNSKLLPIKSIQFKNVSHVSHKTIQCLRLLFPCLTNIEIHGCSFARMFKQNNNIVIDFSGLDLIYLSIDIQDIIQSRKQWVVNEIHLEVFLDTGFHYHRKRLDHPDSPDFQKEESHECSSQSARDGRLGSKESIVITISASSIRQIRLHCDRLGTLRIVRHVRYFEAGFDQLIHLNP